MDEENKPEANEPKPPPPAPINKSDPVDALPTTPATTQQLTEVEEQMSGFEKSTLRWAKTAVIMSAIAAIFVCAQWWEMHEGGADTHGLAVAAKNQADRMQDFANRMKDQNDRTKDLADRMKDQADRTKELVDQAKVQATESTVAANAAKSAADTAKDALHVSERAYLTLGSPTNDFQNGRIEIPILNGGHLPSGHVKILEHEATFVGVAFTGAPIPLSSIVETHWTATGFPSVPVVQNGGIYNVEVQLPKLIQADFNAGKQSILIVVVVTYNDGFEGTPDQSWITCDASTYDTDKKLLTMRPCQDPTPFLTLLNTIDHYPDPSYEIK